MNSEKSINSFEMKKNILPDYSLNNYFICQFINTFSALLLCKINVLDFFDMGDLKKNFFDIAKYWNSDRIELFGNVRAIHP